MLSYYEFLKSIHVLMAVVWVGGAVIIQILAFRIQRENNPLRLAALSGDAGFLGQSVFAPTSIVLVIVGILMVIDSWDFSDAWIIFGLIGFFATVITGIFFLAPESKRLAEMMEQRDPEDREVQMVLTRLLAISRIDMTVLILVVINMVVKPGI